MADILARGGGQYIENRIADIEKPFRGLGMLREDAGGKIMRDVLTRGKKPKFSGAENNPARSEKWAWTGRDASRRVRKTGISWKCPSQKGRGSGG